MENYELQKNKTLQSMSVKMQDNNVPGFMDYAKDQTLVNEPVKKNRSAKKDLEDKSALVENSQTYFERMITQSLVKNKDLVLRANTVLKKSKWEVVTPDRRPFVQNLPETHDDRLIQRKEKAALKAARKTFGLADICTVREKDKLEEYIETEKKVREKQDIWDGDDVEIRLSEYVESILKMEIGSATLSDEYLSEHVAQIFDYVQKLKDYESLNAKHPDFFANLSSDKTQQLKKHLSYEKSLSSLLTNHMAIHGIVIKSNQDEHMIELREEKDSAQTRDNKANLEKQFDRMRDRFISKVILADEVKLARLYIKEDSILSDSTLWAPDEIGINSRANEVCGDEIRAAVSEIKNAYKLRGELLEQLKNLLQDYDAEKNEEQKNKIMGKISRLNRSVRQADLKAENYRTFIDFAAAKTEVMTIGTIDFLSHEGHPELMDIIHVRFVGDCIEAAITGSKKIELRKMANKAKHAGDKNEAERLEKEASEMKYEHMSPEAFHEKIAAYKASKGKEDDPVAAVVRDERLTGKILDDVYKNVFMHYDRRHEKKKGPADHELKKRMDTFGRSQKEMLIEVPHNDELIIKSVLEAVTDYLTVLMKADKTAGN